MTIVVDDEDERRCRAGGSRWRSHGPPAEPRLPCAVTGRRIVKVEPRPSSLLTVMSPPIIWQKRRLIDEPETGAAVFARGGGIGLRKFLEQLPDLLGRHADAGVRHGDRDPRATFLSLLSTHHRNRTALGEFVGIAGKIQQGLAQPHLIGMNRSNFGSHSTTTRLPFFAASVSRVSTTSSISGGDREGFE